MRRTGAFTLVEIIAGVLLFAMGSMAIVGVIIHGLNSAMRAQVESTAWATASSVLKDPLPLGAGSQAGDGTLVMWTWNRSGDTWMATDDAGQTAWSCTTWPVGQGTDILAADMREPVAGNPALFPSGGSPQAGCARGWLNGYYIERREQSRAKDRIGPATRIVEVRVDVYWAKAGAGSDTRPLASLVDRVVRQGAP